MPKKGHTMSDDQKQKIQESMLGKNKGKVWTPEMRKARSEAMKGKNNPNYGKKKTVSKETREKLSELNKKRYEDPEERRKTAEATKKALNKPEIKAKIIKALSSPEVRKKISEGNKKWRKENPEELIKISEKLSKIHQKNWDDPEFRKKRLNPEYCKNLSESAKKQWANPTVRKKMLKGILKAWQNEDRIERVSQFMKNQGTGVTYLKGWHNSPKAGNIMYKSSWELYTFLMLDEDESVLNYVSEPSMISYEFGGRNYSYTIDLKIEFDNLEILFVEIKPRYQLKDLRTKAKIKEAKKLYGDAFQVWTEKEVPGFNTCYWELTEQVKEDF